MVSSQFKVRTRQATDKVVLAALEALWAEARKFHGPEWRPSQHAQSLIYAEHCATLRKQHARKPKAKTEPVPFACVVTARRARRALHRAEKLAFRRGR